MTRYSGLINKGLIEPGRFSRGQVEDLLRIARRRKRNRSIYDTTGAISRKEAAEALETAKEFVGMICGMLEFT